MLGDAPENDDEELDLVQRDDDGEGDTNDPNFIRLWLGECKKDWSWVLGLSNGKENLRFVRVPNRKLRTISAIISKLRQGGSVIDSDGWKGYSCFSDFGFQHKYW